MTEETLKRGLIEIKLKPPLALARFQLIADDIGEELPGLQPNSRQKVLVLFRMATCG